MDGEETTTGGQTDAGTTVLTKSGADTAAGATGAPPSGADTKADAKADTKADSGGDGDGGSGQPPAAGDGQDGDAAKDGQPTGAPEQYSAFDLPEGFSADGPVADEFRAAAKALNLDQAGAQRLAGLAAKLVQQTLDQQREAWAAQTAEWVTAVKADPEIGGPTFDQNIGVAVKALDRFGSPGLKEVLNTTGLGNHPEVIRFMHRVGQAISEDTHVTGGIGGGGAVSTEAYYADLLKTPK